jgi:predicted CoA-substrate-specific enzyme activase
MGTSGRTQLAIGMDVGSTTVKAVVVDPATKAILWSDYQRHHTKQPEYVLSMLQTILGAFPDHPAQGWRMFLTGSGASPLCTPTGGKFVQEVNAVTLAVEHLHPDVGSVIELGGQDAKIIMFKRDEKTGEKTPTASMNDKCASGTGATIDKCFLKVNAPPDVVTSLHFDATKLHHVAAKCGVFAETDIVNLIKSGIPSNEVLCSLADAIVLQNLSVLTRGGTLKHRVLLLGGPNTYLPFLQECWRLRIPQTWNERGYDWPKDRPIEETIFVPENAQYYAALGAVLYGLHEEAHVGAFSTVDRLNDYITTGRKARLGETAGPPLSKTQLELEEFRELYRIPAFHPKRFAEGETVRAIVGLDGGSTSSKAVLVDYDDGTILCKAYQLSKGNPIQDTKELLTQLRHYVEGDQKAKLEIMGFGATGYAADVLQECVRADVNIVETVAHMLSAVHFFGDVDVICDIGGQDIKVLFMKNGDINNFRLSNSCSAGNGTLLQATADSFGVKVADFADVAFRAELAPKFSYGCAVFLDTDRVNFQKEGFSKEEMLAGLAQVLPKNVWQYVVQIPRLAALGTKYVLQGGTQYNLAAVKAQVDYIKERVPEAQVFVHPHTGEAGAIGAAMETLRVVKRKGSSGFIGLDAAINLEYTSKNDVETVCHFCPNECKRTFIDTKRPNGSTSRYIAGFSCEKGTVESKEAMLALVADRKKIAQEFPNVVDYESKKAFMHFYDAAPMPAEGVPVKDIELKRGIFGVRRTEVTRPFRRSSKEHGVRRFVAEHAAMMSFDEVAELRTYTGASVGKRQVEELAVRAAVDFDAFYADRRAANDVVEPTRDLLVMTFDGKGIVMVPEDLRAATKKAAKKAVRKLATRLTTGEQRNRKRMAEVAAIYTVPRYARTPLDVLADLDGSRAAEDRPERPRVRHKRVGASIERDPRTVIEETFHEARARDPQHRRQWVVLVDGNKDQIGIIREMAETLGAVCIVVDLIHVLEYLWRAAHALCGEGTKQAEAWVQQRLLWLLQGRPAGKIATAMRRSARAAKLSDSGIEAVLDAAEYLQDYAPYIRYGAALDWGLPIATGVIEGACRYLVKDRMDRGGARWTLDGAEAVLRLRALRASGDFDAYWHMHLREDLNRNHARRYAHASLPDPISPLRRVKWPEQTAVRWEPDPKASGRSRITASSPSFTVSSSSTWRPVTTVASVSARSCRPEAIPAPLES